MATGNPDETLRIIFKVGTGIATVPPSADHRNGDWLETSIYDQEIYMNDADGKMYTSNGGVIQSIISPFSIGDLSDVDLTGLSATEILQYDGANFVPVAMPTGSNLGNANLTADANRVYTLNGSLASDTLTIEAASGQDIIVFKGDNEIDFYNSSNVNYAQFEESTERFRVARLEMGNIGTAAQYALDVHGRFSSSSGISRYYNSLGNACIDIRQSANNPTIAIKKGDASQTRIFLHGGAGGTTYFNDGIKMAVGGSVGSSTNDTIAFHSASTATAGTVTDAAILYSYDESAGNSCLHTRTEGGDVIKLYKETALTAADATATDGTIGTNDTITNNLRTRLDEIEARLQNQGFLA